MTGKDVSPEERLFKVIQEEKLSKDTPAAEREKPAGGVLNWLDKMRGLLHRGRPVAVAAGAGAGAGRFDLIAKLSEIEPRAINTTLAVVLFLLSAAVLYYSLEASPAAESAMKAISKAGRYAAARDTAIEPFKDASSYIDGTKKRNVFHAIAGEEKKSFMQSLLETPPDEFNKKLADLKLQGITWGRVSKAMIYNEKENKMYFLKEGETIGSTGIKIKTIHQNKIVVTGGGTEAEMI